jgi:hypothetical protein
MMTIVRGGLTSRRPTPPSARTDVDDFIAYMLVNI